MDRETEGARTPGLGNVDPKEWVAPEPGKAPIDLLENKELHDKIKDYLVNRLNMSERHMSNFYSRWRVMEKKYQAFIDLPKYEKILDDLNKKGKPPQVVSIQVPFMFAMISTIVTYLVHTFCGRKPMMQIGSYKAETAESSSMMEIVLQYNADHTRLIKQLFHMLQSSQVYGLGVLRTRWRKEIALRTIRTVQPQFNFFGMALGEKKMASREKRTVYQGNDVETIDPFMFFPDPRVPMTEVNRKGEFVFWRSFEGKHMLLREQFAGNFKYVERANDQLPQFNYAGDANDSARGLGLGGEAQPGLAPQHQEAGVAKYYQVDQGCVEIIPKELGLGQSTEPEKWIFTLLNKCQIIQAQPMDADHGMHPVCVSEPYGLGYGFGNPGISDYLGPFQDTISWQINSHIHNVRTALNNMFVVDPSMVEMQDMRNPDAGKLIRLKKAAYGMDVRMAISQLQVQDVTANHGRDTEAFIRIGQMLGGANDNLMGLQDQGGRKTATEVRTSGEAGASRLAALGRVISAQCLVDMAEQMVLNIQQYLDDEFYLQIVGQQGTQVPIRITPEQLSGDFYYPVHDGTLPLDKVAMLDVWKEILMGVAQDQELRTTYSLPKIFEFVAELGGARNIENMRVQMQVMPPGQGPASGMVPLQQTPAPTAGGPPKAPQLTANRS